MQLSNFVSYIYLQNNCKYMTVYPIPFFVYLCLFVSSNKKKLCMSNKKNNRFKSVDDTTTTGYLQEKGLQKTRITLTHTYRGKYYIPSSNSTPPIPPYSVDNKRKEAPKEKSNEELPAGIGDAYYFSPLIIGDDLKNG